MARPNRLTKALVYLVILLVSGWILSRNLNKPFYGHHDWNGVFYGNIARNYLRYGFLKTKFGQVTNSGIQPVDQFNYYTHYPVLFPVLLSLNYRLLGISEFSTRLMPIVFSLGSILLLYHLAQKLKFSLLASLATTTIVFTPMVRYFGKMPTQEAMMVFFSLLSVILYLNKNFKLLLFTAFLNGLTGWAGYFLYPLLALHSYLFRRSLWRQLVKTCFVLLFTFILHLLHLYFLTGSLVGGSLISALLLRLNLTDYPQFTWIKYLIQQARWLTIYYTRTFLLAAGIVLTPLTLKVLKRRRLNQSQSIILLFFFWGLSYPLIFSNVVFIHEYFNIFFLPFFALAFAWLINQLWQKSQLLAIISAVILTSLIFNERLSFYQALENTQAHKSGYKLGSLINQIVPFDQPALVFASSNYISNNEVFIKYYADRKINFAIYDQPGLDQASKELLPTAQHIFTFTADQPGALFIDNILATQSGTISYEKFNYYY